MFLGVVDHCTLPENADAVTHFAGFALAADRFQLAVEGLQDRFSLSLQLDSTASSEIVVRAVILRRRYRISQWDATILAAAAALGCATVYSEDMNDGQDYDGVRVVNPFT